MFWLFLDSGRCPASKIKSITEISTSIYLFISKSHLTGKKKGLFLGGNGGLVLFWRGGCCLGFVLFCFVFYGILIFWFGPGLGFGFGFSFFLLFKFS